MDNEVAFAIEFDLINNRYHPIKQTTLYGDRNAVHLERIFHYYGISVRHILMQPMIGLVDMIQNRR
jgi:hypothetical protein